MTYQPLPNEPRGWSGLTATEILYQSHACHPDWGADIHLAYLQHEEGINPEHLLALAESGETTPLDTIRRILRPLR